MNKQIINYLKNNKDKYSREQLVEALKKAGHSEEDIQKGVEAVYHSQKEQKTGFWDFKTRKHYINGEEKVLDLIVGVVLFSAWTCIVFGIVIKWLLPPFLSSGFYELFVFILIPMGVFLLVVILALIFLFIKRRFMFYGLLVSFLCFIGFVGYIIFRFFTTPLY